MHSLINFSVNINVCAYLFQVTHVSLVLVTRDFNPEKYECLSSILTKLYAKTGSPASMLERYLSVITKGKCNSEDNGMFIVAEYETRQAFVVAPVRGDYCSLVISIILEMLMRCVRINSVLSLNTKNRKKNNIVVCCKWLSFY